MSLNTSKFSGMYRRNASSNNYCFLRDKLSMSNKINSVNATNLHWHSQLTFRSFFDCGAAGHGCGYDAAFTTGRYHWDG